MNRRELFRGAIAAAAASVLPDIPALAEAAPAAGHMFIQATPITAAGRSIQFKAMVNGKLVNKLLSVPADAEHLGWYVDGNGDAASISAWKVSGHHYEKVADYPILETDLTTPEPHPANVFNQYQWTFEAPRHKPSRAERRRSRAAARRGDKVMGSRM
jgi:hypothetical protein